MKAWFAAAFALVPLAAMAQGSEEDRLTQIRTSFNDRLTQQGDIWFDDGDFPKIAHTYKVRAEFFPHFEEAWTDLIYMLFNIKAAEEELAAAIRLRDLNPDNPNCLMPEAEVYSRIGTRAYAKAIPILEKAIAMTPPPHPNAYRVLGSCYKRFEMFDSAIRTYTAMLKVYPDDAQAKANLKNCQDALKKKLSG